MLWELMLLSSSEELPGFKSLDGSSSSSALSALSPDPSKFEWLKFLEHMRI